jgi:hypothetical protein
VDAISPAFQNCKRLLFQSGRRRFWWRFGLLGILTGELSSGGSFNFNLPSGGSHHTANLAASLQSAPVPPIPDFAKFGAAIFGIAAVAILLWLCFMFVSSVARFTLFENVIGRDVSFGEGWRRNFSRGVAYFGWMLLFSIAVFALLVIVVGGPLLSVYLSGGFANGHVSSGAVGAIVWAVFSVLVLAVGSLVLWVLLKDFVVPMMQLENEPFEEGCRRVMGIVREEKGSFAGYIGMKVVLRIGAMFFLGIIFIALLIAFAIPVGLVAYWLFSATKAGLIQWGFSSIALAVSAGIIVVICFIYSLGVVGSPITAFFPSYALYFFAGRYPALEQILFPAPPTPPNEPPLEPSPV